MTLQNVLGILFGISLILTGLLSEGKFRNQVEAPLREEDRLTTPKPFTKRWRALYVGFGALLVVLGMMGKFNS
jgi:hypothetical protein